MLSLVLTLAGLFVASGPVGATSCFAGLSASQVKAYRWASKLSGISEGAFPKGTTEAQQENLRLFQSLVLKDGDAWPFSDSLKLPYVYRGFAASRVTSEAEILSVFLGMTPSHHFVQSHNFSVKANENLRLSAYDAIQTAKQDATSSIQADLDSAGSAKKYLKENVSRSLVQLSQIKKDSEALFFTSDPGVAQQYSAMMNDDGFSVILKVKNNGQILDAPVENKDEYEILSYINPDDIEGVFIGRPSIRRGTSPHEYSFFQPVYRGRTLIGFNKYEVLLTENRQITKQFDLQILAETGKFQKLERLEEFSNFDFSVAAIERAPPFHYEDRDLKGDDFLFLNISMHKAGVRYILQLTSRGPSVQLRTAMNDQFVGVRDKEKYQFFIDEIVRHYGGSDKILNKIVDLYPKFFGIQK